jgi:Multidrug resistance efflux pump
VGYVSSIFHGGNGSDRIIRLSGRIEGDDSAVASKTSGRILEVRVREGDSVNAGQILAVLDDQQVRAREEQARGAVEGAEARAKAAKAQIDVLEEQLRQSQLQTEQATVDAEGRVSQAEADLAAAESDLARQEASFQLALFDKGPIRAWRRRALSPNVRGKRRWPMQISRPPPWPPPNDGSRRRRER